MQDENVSVVAETRGLVKSPQDMFAGLFIIAFGLACLWASSNLSGGRGANLGPGSFPRGLSFLLMAVGGIIVFQALTVVGPRLEAWSIRGPVFVLGAVLIFAMTIRGTTLNIPGIGRTDLLPPLGLIVAGPLTLIVASLASTERNWTQTFIFSACMTAFCILLFKVALRLPIPVAPWAGW
ncbi:tripartite tricarboxylate transporter TctB family protein [Phreatobacter sp.]|uniref:tripartite tricarboxylate transporter TctB family protein n=1 Tax=Phreatobacter sp. TaxID=1966341 RepID=UPI0025F2D10F|nr:tripartite tricarboxylate transporter TctB family protein [Phreatobacter sp.]